jgi:DNA-binding NarL/FixJ family response regulator
LSRTRIVLLSAYLDAEIVSLARSAGAAGYLSKDGSREVICSTLLRLGREPDALHGGDRTGARGERME